MAKKKNHRKYRPKMQRQQARPYGKASEETFEPLNAYKYVYGCTEIQYKDPKTGKYITL